MIGEALKTLQIIMGYPICVILIGIMLMFLKKIVFLDPASIIQVVVVAMDMAAVFMGIVYFFQPDFQ